MDKFKFLLNHEKNILHTKYYGDIELNDIQEAIVQGNKMYPGLDSIVDFSDATLINISPRDVRSLVYLALEHEPENIKCAFVVPSNLEFGLTRMYDSMVDGDLSQQREIFGSLKEAEDWFRQRADKSGSTYGSWYKSTQ